MYSKPWAWVWTFVIGLGSGAAALLGAGSVGLQLGWAVAAGLAAAFLCGGACAFYIFDRGAAQARTDSTGDTSQRDSQ